MALIIGSENADTGMSQAIYLEMDRLLSPPLQEAVDKAQGAAKTEAQKALDEARKGWKKLAFAIANGVINHIVANMEIFDITTRGDVTTSVQGNTAVANPGNHQHNINLVGTASNIVFTQNNNGTGRVR